MHHVGVKIVGCVLTPVVQSQPHGARQYVCVICYTVFAGGGLFRSGHNVEQ